MLMLSEVQRKPSNLQPRYPLEIESSSSHVPIRGPEMRAARRSRPTNTDAGEFNRTDALRQALADTPDIRPEEVERARKLISTSQYPPPETLDRLARLLAIAFTTDSGVDSAS